MIEAPFFAGVTGRQGGDVEVGGREKGIKAEKRIQASGTSWERTVLDLWTQ